MIERRVDVTKYDPRKLGLKVGLEVHQQLDTRRKLFCNCPTKLVEEEGDVFERRLRPTRSELGEVDVAALFEWRKGRRYEYHAPHSASCLVEADEEPPHEMDRESLVVALAAAKAVGGEPVDEVHVMRKIVIDGSNTTGFQRTAIVALGGSIELPSGKRIGIETIAVEEDAARKLGEERDRVKFKLDRLGIPLVEVSTAPDIETPEEALEAAYAIGQLFRLMGKAKRGIGTIRQDLNVSIRGGAKTEIKGVQRLDLLPKVVLYEAIRQARLLEIRDELRRRGVTAERVRGEARVVDVTDVFRETKSKVVRRALKSGGKVLALKLPGFAGLLGVEVQPGRRFGTELADYARFWGGVGGIFHTDELPAYGITAEEVEKVREAVGAGEGDAVVIVADEEPKARKALEAVLERAAYACIGVPEETRAALEDGTTRFMRPRPGRARMYPETDIPPVEITEELLAEAGKLVPEPAHVKLKRFTEEWGLSEQLAKQILRDIHLALFEKLVREYGGKVPATWIASLFVNTLRSLQREGVPVDNISEERIEELVTAVAEGRIARDAVEEVLKYLAEHPEATVEDAAKALGLGRVSLEEVERVVEDAIRKYEAEVKQRCMKAFNKIMGEAMRVLRGKVDGRTVAEVVRRKIAEVCGA